MRTFSRAFILLAALGFHLPASAANIDSVYTELSGPNCKALEENATEGWAKGRCRGTAGYMLDWSEGDLRQTLNVIDPKGRDFPLELWSTVASGFSSLGDKAEWRVKKVGKKVSPIALIVRYNVSEDPEKPEKTTSYLTVSKITADEVCVTDVVKPGSDANQQARDLADIATSKQCKSSGEATEPAPPPVEGTIVGYECGDNCYLTIKDAQGEEHTGLCTAPLCDSWNEATTMPDSFKGKRVKVVVGIGEQFDAGGNKMGTMDSFDSIELLDAATKPVAGGLSPTDTQDAEVVKAAEFAAAQMGQELDSIVEASQQVVAGMNYSMTLKLKNGETWVVTVYKDLQGQYSLSEYSKQ